MLSTIFPSQNANLDRRKKIRFCFLSPLPRMRGFPVKVARAVLLSFVVVVLLLLHGSELVHGGAVDLLEGAAASQDLLGSGSISSGDVMSEDAEFPRSKTMRRLGFRVGTSPPSPIKNGFYNMEVPPPAALI